MIVVDLGCHPHGNDVSIGPLIERFRPEYLYGFDPYPDLEEGVTMHGETVVTLARQAAWVYDGAVGITFGAGHLAIRSTVMPERPVQGTSMAVPCFDLVRWLEARGPSHRIVMKMDVEGAEYPLLTYLAARGADLLLSLLLVEWHDIGDPQQRRLIESTLRCPVEAW